MLPEILVIIPTYNESSNIERLINDILSLGLNIKILIIDDNSPDGTADMIKKIREKDRRVNLILRDKKSGLGPAYVTGFRYGLDKNYEYIIEMDGDFSHDPRKIPGLINNSIDCDIVVGSRYIKGGGVAGWSFYRKLLSRIGNLYSRMVTGIPVKDTTSGFKCFRNKVIRSFALNNFRAKGYLFQIETLFYSYKNGFRIKEIPIVFNNRVRGKSKMGQSIIWEALLGVWKLRLSGRY
jgi:dolichol-phosphate mannosyltransferase